MYIHPEAEYHPSTTLQKIIDAGMVPGIAINPGTSVETVLEMLRIVKKVLVMSVNPGNAGQMYLPYVGKKITKLLTLKEDMDFEMYWDGACSAERILEFAPKGMKGFVLGTTLLFGKDRPYGENPEGYQEFEAMNTALILSGGVGSRLGGDMPKQYIEVGGRMILSYCLEKLSQHPKVDAIQIVAQETWRGWSKAV